MAKVCKSDGQETFAGTQGNGEVAPKAAVRLSWVERVKTDPTATLAARFRGVGYLIRQRTFGA